MYESFVLRKCGCLLFYDVYCCWFVGKGSGDILGIYVEKSLVGELVGFGLVEVVGVEFVFEGV